MRLQETDNRPLISKRVMNALDINERMMDGLDFKKVMDEGGREVLEFKLQGQSGETYTVRYDDDHWTCDCPDYEYRATCEESFICKHIYAVLLFILP